MFAYGKGYDSGDIGGVVKRHPAGGVKLGKRENTAGCGEPRTDCPDIGGFRGGADLWREKERSGRQECGKGRSRYEHGDRSRPCGGIILYKVAFHRMGNPSRAV